MTTFWPMLQFSPIFEPERMWEKCQIFVFSPMVTLSSMIAVSWAKKRTLVLAQGDAVYLLTSGQFKRVVFSDLLAAGNGFTDGRKGYPQPPA
jgi:hypothetical protein